MPISPLTRANVLSAGLGCPISIANAARIEALLLGFHMRLREEAARGYARP
jgi:hypothetical protein